jgi:hypothetical protein
LTNSVADEFHSCSVVNIELGINHNHSKRQKTNNKNHTPVECLRRYVEMLPHQNQQNKLLKENETIKKQIKSNENKIKETNKKLIELH